MNPLHAGLFFVLLLLPNTTLRDWQSANAPHLHQIMATGCIALMNARTAEEDKITPQAGVNTLMAGARMRADGSDEGLSYPARADNLPVALGVEGVETHPDASNYVLSATPPASGGGGSVNVVPSSLPPPEAGGVAHQGRGGSFLVITLPTDPAKADEAIGKWAGVVRRKGGELMVASPNPSPAEYAEEDQLTPVVLWGKDVPAGVLISPSTHTPGLVTNTDIAPTIASYFHAKLLIPPFGAALTTQSATNAPATLAHQDLIWQSQAREQQAVPYIAGVIALLVAGVTLFTLRTGRGSGGFAVLAVALPLALIMSGALPIFFSLVISAIGGAFVMRRRAGDAILWLSCATALAIVADAVLFAGRATSHSLLGYSPMEGARYYGLGNEAMGILVGALVVVTGALVRFKKGWMGTVLIWLIAGFALGWPGAGAKAGGFFVVLISLAAYAWVATGQQVRRPMPWIVTIAGICALGALLALAGKFVGHNHIGQAVELAQSQGMAAVRSLVWRKGAMDLHLVFHSVWALVLICGVAGAILLIRKRGLEEVGRVGVVTGFAATAACLALNDAGVVAAALCSLYLWAFCAVGPSEDRQSAAQEA